MERMIELELVTKEKGQPSPAMRRYRVSFEGKEIGVWRDPENSAARYLLDNGLAGPEEILWTNRGLRGSVGWFAKRQVDEESMRYVKWRPNPFAAGGGIPQKPASDDLEAS